MEFRPISLGNIVSRIISKVLANHIKVILPNVISDSQSAFVPNRNITDNTTIAFEMLHHMRNRRKEKTCHMAAKLDISKAYDRVEWEFLRCIMLKIGLPNQWVQLAMETVCTASYSILLSGEPTGFITPSRGIKQGDPLSSYLFLLCAEGFSSLIWKAIDNQHLKGVVSCKGRVKLSHLLFVDDSLLFCEATTKECRNILDILALYEAASRQAINRQKTTLFFSTNTNHGVKQAIQNMLGAQTIPTYSMSMFKFPKKICDDINSVLAKYWWGQARSDKKIHWINWGKLCKPKDKGNGL